MKIIKILLVLINVFISTLMIISIINYSDVSYMIPCDGCGFFYRSKLHYILYSLVNATILIVLAFFIVKKSKIQNISIIFSIFFVSLILIYSNH
jgi:hypothetical protein